MTHVGSQIRWARRARGYSQRDLVKRMASIGIQTTQPRITRHENCAHVPAASVKDYAEALGVPIDLLYGAEPGADLAWLRLVGREAIRLPVRPWPALDRDVTELPAGPFPEDHRPGENAYMVQPHNNEAYGLWIIDPDREPIAGQPGLIRDLETGDPRVVLVQSLPQGTYTLPYPTSATNQPEPTLAPLESSAWGGRCLLMIHAPGMV